MRVAAPSRFWVIEKDGTAVMRIETTADDPTSVEYVIPNSCEPTSVDDRESMEAVRTDVSVLSASEKRILGI